MANGNGAKTKKQLAKETEALSLREGSAAVLEAEHKEVERVWGETKQDKAIILDSLSELVVFQDLEHRVLWANRIAGESVGIASEKLVGRYCYDIWGKGGKPCPGCPVEKARRTRKSQAGEMTTPDGKVWLIKGYPIMNAGGDVTGLVEMALEITERKWVEDALQEEKNKLQSVIGAMEDGLTIQDKDFNIIYLNEQLRANYGDRVGEKCYKVYEDRDTVCVGCPVKKAFKDGKSHTSERKVVLPSGETAYGENIASPIKDAAGNIVSCLEIVRDSTERRQAEDELQESEAKYKALAEGVPIGIYITDLSGKILYGNEKAAEIVGCKREELIGENILGLKLLDTKEEAKTRKLIALSKLGKETGPAELVLNRRDGTKSIIEINYRIITVGGEKVVLSMVEDITERKQAEDELQTEKNKLQSVISAMEDGLTIQDRDLNILYMNEPLKANHGNRVGEKCYQVYENRETACDDCPVTKAFKDGKSHTSERKVVLPSGEIRYGEAKASPVKDAAGNIVSCLEITRNITERKQAEEELQTEKNKLQSVIDSLEYGITIQDRDYNIIYQNEQAKKPYGDHLGEKCYRAYAYKEKVCVRCPVAQAFKDGKSHTEVRKNVLPSGELAYWENTASPIRDAKGNIVSCLEITRNITKRKQVEEELQAEKNKLQSVISAMEDSLTIQDRDFNIIYQNESSRLSSGGDHVGERCYRAYEDRDTVCDGCPVEKAFKDGKSHTTERKNTSPSGETVYWETTANPIRDAKGKIISCLELARDITERKKAEEKLADELTRHRILIDQSSDGIVILDQNGKVYEANQRFAEMLGYTPKEVRELHVWDWEADFPPEKVAEMIATVGPEGDHFETRHRRKDGTTIDVEISTNGAVYAGQKLIFCVQRDITERKRAEQALAEAEKKYKNLVEAASDLIWEADTQGMYTFVSPNIKELLGYEVEEVVGKKRTLDFTPKKEIKKWLKRFKGVNAKRKTFAGFEVLHHHKDGTPLIFEVSGSPFFDNEGNFKGYVGINKNVTERKRVTEALRESQKFSTSLLENSPNPKIVLNPDTSIRYANPAFEKLTGYKLGEIADMKAPYPWWLKEDSKAMTSSLKKAMLSGGKKSEKVFLKKNGERFWVALNSAPVVHRKKLRYFLISWLDITDRKRAEEEKIELEQKAHLASRLASVGEMASGIAHEINNPLTAVIGFAQLLMDNDLPEEIKEDLVIIHKEAQRAAGVARNLLTFARKHAPSQQPTSINNIIEGVLTLRAYEQNVSNIQINTKLAPDLPEVMADYSQLQQVFINIILNAEAAMLDASNGGTLTITTQRFNHSVRASFADDGPGIDKENLDRIFDPFFTTKEVGKGTGLGLSVCHGIIAEHGGKIYARSKPGSGATFIVELPINAQEQSEETNEPA